MLGFPKCGQKCRGALQIWNVELRHWPDVSWTVGQPFFYLGKVWLQVKSYFEMDQLTTWFNSRKTVALRAFLGPCFPD